MSEINPNNLTFKQGLERIDDALRKTGLQIGQEIITSRDERVMKAQELLETKNVPQGFKKWQLPVAMRCETQLFITVAPPGAKVSRHSHNEGPGIRFIATGSIIHKGKELTTGDWMYIPAGVPYELEVGQYGATMCYCYCCCCAWIKNDPLTKEPNTARLLLEKLKPEDGDAIVIGSDMKVSHYKNPQTNICSDPSNEWGKKGKSSLSVQENKKGKDELSVLTRSFNLMLETIRNHGKKQDELTKDLAKANEELKQASRLKDDFISVAAHELRNPVQPILGLAQILRSRKMRSAMIVTIRALL